MAFEKRVQCFDCLSDSDGDNMTQDIFFFYFERISGFHGMRNKSESAKQSLDLSSTAQVDPAIRSFTLKAITSTEGDSDKQVDETEEILSDEENLNVLEQGTQVSNKVWSSSVSIIPVWT